MSEIISTQSQDKISEAIRRAELQTSAEIVPMVVWQSTPTFHVFPILFLFFALISALTFPFLHLDTFYPLLPWQIALGLAVASIILPALLSQLEFVQDYLTPDNIELHNVEQRALVEFCMAKMDKTRERTGVLIFVSLREKKAVVLADEAISSKIDKNAWNEILKELIGQIKTSGLEDGFISAIEKTGNFLSPVFPCALKDRNELPNRLIVKQ